MIFENPRRPRLLIVDLFFDRFLVPSWRQNRVQDRPRRPQDAPKTATRPQLVAQVGPQNGPKTAQDGPNRPQIDRRTPQDASKTAQDENEILPKTKPRTRTLSTIPRERPTSKRSAVKLPPDRRAPELQKRGAAVLPPRMSSI